VRTVVIHQPNYLPGLTYFDKITACDVFVFLDDVQYSKGNWINRNRIKGAHGAQWLTVPVATAGRLRQRIDEAAPDAATGWVERHLRTVQSCYGRAPHLRRYADLLAARLRQPWPSLAELNIALIVDCCAELGLRPAFMRSSALAVSGSGTERLVAICRAVGGDVYLSGPGGLNYQKPAQFAAAGIGLRLRKFVHPVYRQLHGAFEPNLSILDLLMNEGPGAGGVLAASGSRTVELVACAA